MKQLLTILCVLGMFIAQAQEPQKQETKEERQQRYIEEVNPFKQLGYKPRISTLSNGKYREAFPDTIVQIGNFTYNRITKRITKMKIIERTALSEATLRADLVSRWMSADPLSDEFPSWSPYNFVKNNPIRFVDPLGLAPEDVIIKGGEKDKAFQELQASVQGQLTLSMDSNGKVTYAQDGNGRLSRDARQLTGAIDDSSITVNVNAENTMTTTDGSLYIGGAFGGNTVTNSADGNTVVAEQNVNPNVLSTVSTAHGSPGAEILHEVTEAYQGAVIAQQSGNSTAPASIADSNNSRSVYSRAHRAATNQTGKIYQDVFNAAGTKMQARANGSYPSGAAKAEWYVNDSSGNRVIIQTLK